MTLPPTCTTLKPEPGDVIVCAFPERITQEHAMQVREQLRDGFPDHRCIVIVGGTLASENRWAAFTDQEIDSILHGLNADLPSSDGLTRARLIGDTHRELTRRKDA